MGSLELSILKAVTYFNVFSYPLTAEEILFFLDCPARQNKVKDALERLIENKLVWQYDKFYAVSDDFSIAERRTRGNKLAIKYIKRARTVAKFLYWFPFVRGIAISGSLSKTFADENVDLDFFVIAKTNRLWILRMMLAALFKTANVCGLKKWFCINYIIDETALVIEEKNVFTAVEISTLMPLKGKVIFNDFFKANNWVYEYLPNYTPNYTYMKDVLWQPVKQLCEWTINSANGNKIDDRSLHFFKQRFEKFFAKQIVVEKGYIIWSYIVTKHAYKPMPQYFQPKILLKFKEHFAIVKDKYQHSISKESVL